MVSRGLPTAAKLVSALGFGLLGWLAAAVLQQGLPEGMLVGIVPEGAAVAGLVCGWHILGPSVGRGYGAAIGTGLRTGVIVVVLVLLGLAIWEMLEAAVRRQYPGPFEALMGMVDLTLRYGAFLGYGPFLGVMAAGSALIGVMAEVAGRRWT